MKAIVVRRFGGPEQLAPADVDDPAPRPGECLIAVEASDVLFLETMLRAGLGAGPMTPGLPWVPGNGIAGMVVGVGDGVPGTWIGRRVAAHTGNRGGYAERAAVALDAVVPIPDGLDTATAAALLHDGPTAVKLVEVTRPGTADAVLVLGASGGLGLALVQLARRRAARVVAVARDPAKRARIAQFGPDALIDPEDPRWIDHAREALGPDGATVVLDNVGGPLGRDALALLAPGGRFSAHATHDGRFTVPAPDEVRERRATVTGIEQVQLAPDELARLTERAFALAGDELHPVIGQTYALEDAADAHRAIESRRVFGKTLLTVGS